MKIVLLEQETIGTDLDLAPLYARGEVVCYLNTPPELVAERIRDADVVVLNKIKLHKENLSGAKRLKLICPAATGYDNIDTEYCREHGIALCNVPGYSTDSVAQLTVTMALALVTRLQEYRDFVHSGQYTASGVANRLTPAYHEISSMTWGVVGGGGIGNRVAEIAKTLGCRVLVCRRKQEGSFPLADMDTLCRECDILSFHVPLTEETRGMLSRERIAAMKKGAIVVNTARGAVTDEQALADAVKSGHLGGLGVDVYSVEPFGKEHPFYSLLEDDHVCLTPHTAWAAVEARTRCLEIIGENIRCFFAGTPQNRIV